MQSIQINHKIFAISSNYHIQSIKISPLWRDRIQQWHGLRFMVQPLHGAIYLHHISNRSVNFLLANLICWKIFKEKDKGKWKMRNGCRPPLSGEDLCKYYVNIICGDDKLSQQRFSFNFLYIFFFLINEENMVK